MNLFKYVIERITVTTLNGVEYDCTGSTVDLEITESIFEPYLFGSIIIKDMIRFFEYNHLFGGEQIQITIKRNNQDEESLEWKNFYVRSFIEVNTNTVEQFRTKVFELQFVEKEYFTSLKQFSKSYNKKLCSDIVKDICSNMATRKISSENIDTTKGLFSIAFPYMTPIEMINYISDKYSVSTKNKYGYFFYTDITGKQYYKNISSLLEQKEDYKLILSTPVETNYNVNIPHNYTFSGENFIDIDKNISNGFFGNTDWYFDITESNSIKKVENTYQKFKSDVKAIGKYSLYNKSYADVKNVNTINTNKNNKSKNDMVLNELNQMNFTVDHEGALYKKVGKIALIEFMPYYNDNYDTKYDLKYSGKWLSVIQKHTFNTSGYNILTTYVKNAYDIIKKPTNILTL